MDKTLLKGLKVLEAVTDVESPCKTVDELAAHVGLTRSNTHRTLQTLMHAGYVVKDEAGYYRGTIRLFELGARQLTQLDVRKLASPAMNTLAEQTIETVHLSVLDGLDVVYIEKIDCPQPIRTYSMVGGRVPAYAVATGKVLLAYQPEGYLEHFANALAPHTLATLTSMEVLKKELHGIAQAGYAVNHGEWRDGVGGIAAAIFDSNGQPVAAVGISVPLDRLLPKMKQFVPQVVACAKSISLSMGYRYSSDM